MRVHALWAGVPVALVLMSPNVSADWAVNLPRGVTEVSQSIYHLHMTIFWICVVIGIVVFGVMLWSVLFHRKSLGHKSANFHEHTLVEIAWTIVPLLILVAMAVPATATLLDMYNTSKSAVDIKITGYQWKWHYQYLDDKFGFFSVLSTPQDEIHNMMPKDKWYLREVDKPLVLPVGEKVRFLVTSNDVIHSWWVPDLGVKKDAIPGYINETWARIDKPGIYRGQCAELCGQGHAFMPIVVKAVPKADYDKWVAEQRKQAEQLAALNSKTWTMAELMSRGKDKFDANCAVCHQATGVGQPPTIPPLKGRPITTGPDPSQHIYTVIHGRPGTMMPAFGKQLSPVDIAAIITYERNAWGNNTGQKVTPQEVLKAEQEK
ncbi:cytochrome c oxidase subunit II [Mangrovitalea sediminis]|uniref:cytochrome c oxidase subunit II n=1 Tax=Mangrovitalea sediminis TaxID=1982043 RepID=UPI000BE4BDA1